MHGLARGRRVASSDDTTVRLWDVLKGQSRATLKGHTSEVLALTFSAARPVAGQQDGTIYLWEPTGSAPGSACAATATRSPA